MRSTADPPASDGVSGTSPGGEVERPSDRERVACVELPALPLQLLLLEHPAWRELPVAIVESDRPQAKLLWVNEHARARRVLPGMRYAAARSLARDLRATVFTAERMEAAVDALFAILLDFSPRIEPEADAPGTVWIDPAGMTLLWGELESWALAVEEALAQRGLGAVVVVGFHRFRTLAIARAHAHRANPDTRDREGPQAWVLRDRRAEARMAASVPLDRLGISPRLRDELASLGVRSLGEFMALPAVELRGRLGVEAEALQTRASEGAWAPLEPRRLIDPLVQRTELDPPEGDVTRLLFRIEPALSELLSRLADRGAALSALQLRLELDHDEPLALRLEPAAPTLDARLLLELVRLRLDALDLPAPVELFVLELEGQRADPRQIALFRAQTRRDLDAANRALARIRAALGPESVTRAALLPAHLPEARYRWEPASAVQFPLSDRMAVDGERPPQQRRVLAKPRRLPNRPRREPDGWIIDPSLGPVERLHGPHRASGGWWVREVSRDYYYAQTRSGATLWVYYDRPRRGWYLHGYLD